MPSTLEAIEAKPRLEGSALRTVAICGPPNVGKSTFFNRLTGLHQKVANYPGITVEKRIGRLELGNGQPVNLIDLPGIVGLHPRSEDERIAVEVLRGTSRTTPQPAAAILLLDSTNLEAQLRLVPEILGCGVPTLVALNMVDDLAARGGSVDAEAVAKQVGAPVVAISARLGTGMDKVTRFLEGTLAPPPLVELPVLNNIPAERQWAGGIARGASYHPPEPSLWGRRLDRAFLHPVAGTVDLPGRGRGRVPKHLHPGGATDGRG